MDVQITFQTKDCSMHSDAFACEFFTFFGVSRDSQLSNTIILYLYDAEWSKRKTMHCAMRNPRIWLARWQLTPNMQEQGHGNLQIN